MAVRQQHISASFKYDPLLESSRRAGLLFTRGNLFPVRGVPTLGPGISSSADGIPSPIQIFESGISISPTSSSTCTSGTWFTLVLLTALLDLREPRFLYFSLSKLNSTAITP
ncbi:hypothetical protein J6590_083721 [Homalodisca vitripennis]|nr:hypothetical protein J6590_083721 [Homalodisca vitripennis]